MSEQDAPKKSKHRVFVHDIANDLTIADGALTKTLFLLNKRGLTEEDEEIVKLNKAKKRVKDMVDKLKEYGPLSINKNLPMKVDLIEFIE